MKQERPGHVLQTTALVNEAYMRLIQWNNLSWQNRAHFVGVSGQLMRRILVDMACSRPHAAQGGEAHQVPLDQALAVSQKRGTDLVALDDALNAWPRSTSGKAGLWNYASLVG